MMSWLDNLLKQTENTEAPERYYWWSGLAAISAVVRKNVYLDKPSLGYTLYPNIYVILISEKSGGKKGQPVSICKRLLTHAKLARVISGGDNSIQGVIESLSSPATVGIHVIKEAQAIILSSEFSSFLKRDPQAIAHLTDLYGTHEHEDGWEKTLKSGPTKLVSPCITMLVASNEPYLDKAIDKADIEGGFIGRSVYVKESKMRKPNPGTDDPDPEHTLDIPKLATRLKEIAAIKGGFKWTPKPKKLYNDWYMATYEDEVDDRTGTYNRLGDQVLKVAMLVSLASKDRLEFDCEDIQIAIDKCQQCANDAMGMTQSESTNGSRPNIMKLVFRCILAAEARGKNISEASILNTLQPYSLTVPQVESQLNYLIGSGLIEKNTISGTGNVYSRIVYGLTDEGRKRLKL